MLENHRLNDFLTSYTDLQQKLHEKPVLLQQVVDVFLSNIVQGENLNAFIRVYRKEAKARAEEIIHRLQQGKKPSLAGMVIGIKDLFCYKDHIVQASSRILDGFISQINATSVTKILEAGAIVVGHQNCDEFGMGSSNEHSTYGPTRNPIEKSRSAGGSSGGSAAAVKAHMCHASLGTDTGGSVRQPASFCGVVGLKPTYERISRYGVIAYSPSFDTVGIIAHNVADCARILNIIAGQDKKDMISLNCPVDDYTALLDTPPTSQKIGYLKQTLDHPGLQKEVYTHTKDLIDKLAKAGHEVTAIDFSLLDYTLPTYYILTTGEASTELARYDGVRYGYRVQADSFQEMVRKTRTAGFGSEVKRRLMLGAFVLTSDYYDSYYQQAQKVRQKIKNVMTKMFDTYDYIICPTTPTTAFPLDKKDKDPIIEYLADLYTVPASVAGLPAISVPNGCDDKGLPIGIQIIGKPLGEQKLLQFASYVLSMTADKNQQPCKSC